VSTTERPAEPREVCTCGRPAAVVFISDEWGEVGYCGIADGGRPGPCAFCGAPASHDGQRCGAYTLRPVRARSTAEPAVSVPGVDGRGPGL
jgi:hypothetical protein